MSLNKFQKISLTALGIIFLVFVLYAIIVVDKDIKVNEETGENETKFALEVDEVEKKRLILAGIIFLSVGAVITVIVLINRHYKNRKKKKKDYEEDVTAPKMPVSTTEILRIFRDSFIKYNEIPFRFDISIDKNEWVDDKWAGMKVPPKIVTTTELYLQIHNMTSFSSEKTGDDYCIFEVVCNMGNMHGIHVFILKSDRGKEWIRENWNWRVRERISLNRYKLDEKHFPLNSSASKDERLLNARFEMLTSDEYDPQDVKVYNDLVNELKNKNGKTTTIIEKEKEVVEDAVQEISYVPEIDDTQKTDTLQEVLNDVDGKRK